MIIWLLKSQAGQCQNKMTLPGPATLVHELSDREFSADRGAAIITGRPSNLISALMKISGDIGFAALRDGMSDWR